MAAEVAKAQLELNKTIVSATGSYFKYFTFFMWFGPFMIGTVSPLERMTYLLTGLKRRLVCTILYAHHVHSMGY